MSSAPEYEYAEVVAGFFIGPPGVPMRTFMHVRDISGDKTTADFTDGALGALNIMGAQGWKLVSERQPSPGRMGWVAAALHDDLVHPERFEATEFLMMRAVRD